jgi:hypothetical protein
VPFRTHTGKPLKSSVLLEVKRKKIPYEWFHGSWLMPILEVAGFGVQARPGADLDIEGSVSTVNIYA